MRMTEIGKHFQEKSEVLHLPWNWRLQQPFYQLCVCVFMCNEQTTKSTSVYSRSGNETLHPLAATPTSIHAEVGNFHYPAYIGEETQRCFRPNGLETCQEQSKVKTQRFWPVPDMPFPTRMSLLAHVSFLTHMPSLARVPFLTRVSFLTHVPFPARVSFLTHMPFLTSVPFPTRVPLLTHVPFPTRVSFLARVPP